MDKDLIIVFDEKDEKKTVERFEFYAKLMEKAYNSNKKGEK